MELVMDVGDTLTVETPEQVGIEFELAGLASRFLAAVVDLLCMLIFLFAAVVLAMASIAGGGDAVRRVGRNIGDDEPWTKGLDATATILLMLAVFVVQWGYYIICEMTMGGASPGKRALGLRVIRDDGAPIGFGQSLVRNLVRVVDFLPSAYGIGLVAIFVSRRSQRLGDVAAGTLVTRVRAPVASALPLPAAAWPQLAPSELDAAPPLAPRERALVRDFVARLPQLQQGARDQLARAIAGPLRPRFEASALPDEAWLIRLAGQLGPPT